MDNKYRKADYIFTNGIIITVNSSDEIVQALAVSDNRILCVGDNRTVMKTAVPETRIIDLAGKTMTPGFIDAHAHTAMTGMNKNTFPDISPQAAPDLESLYEIVEGAVKEAQAGEWVIFWGYDELRMDKKEHPCRARLDEIAPDHPLLVARCDGHSGVVNTQALKATGFMGEKIYKYKNNEIGRTDGELNGYVADAAYYDIWSYADINTDKIVSGLELESKINLGAGITGVHDAGGFSRISNYGYKAAVEQGRYKLRATVMSWSMLGKEHYMDDCRKYRELGFGSYIGNDRLKFGLEKIMIDGGSSGPGCAVRESYSHDPGNFGTLSLTQKEIDDFVMTMHRSGHQVTAHASGDRAVEMWLDAIEKAQEAYPRKDPRHRVEHACIMAEDLILRMKKLGVIPTPNPGFIPLNAERYLKFFGDRVNTLYPLKSYLEAGIPCAFGSDNPIVPENPLISIAAAMTRSTSDGRFVVGECQKIELLDAIRMHTYNCAYSTFDEDKLGSLEEGKLADLAVYDGDFLKASPMKLLEMKCVLTMVNGEIVYQA